MKCSDGQYFEPPQGNIGDEATETFLDKVLAAATICRQQHLAQQSPHETAGSRTMDGVHELFPQLLVFETHLHSYFYGSHFDSYFLFTSYPAN